MICPKAHYDTFEVTQNELVDLKNNGSIEQSVYGLLGCNICEDFYELDKEIIKFNEQVKKNREAYFGEKGWK